MLRVDMSIAENGFGFISIWSDNVAEVCILDMDPILVRGSGQPLRARIKQDVSVNVFPNYDLKSKEDKSGLFVDLFSDRVEGLT